MEWNTWMLEWIRRDLAYFYEERKFVWNIQRIFHIQQLQNNVTNISAFLFFSFSITSNTNVIVSPELQSTSIFLAVFFLSNEVSLEIDSAFHS